MDAEKQKQGVAHLASLVGSVLDQGKTSGLSEMLKGIAELLNINGCVLWRVAASAIESPQAGRLITLAQWYEDGRVSPVLYELPLHSSATGRAILTGRTLNVIDVEHDSRVYRPDPFVSNGGVRTFCSIPFRFADGTAGALNLYRDTPSPLTEDEIALAEALATAVPALYQAVKNKLYLELIGSVDAILRPVVPRPAETSATVEGTQEVMREVCERVADALQSVETSIFLKSPSADSELYELVATTWPVSLRKSVYERTPAEGLTGWVLAKARPLRVFDLARFARDELHVAQEHLSVVGEDVPGNESAVPKFLQADAGSEFPLSFMAAPVMAGEDVLGVIRCHTGGDAPYYFEERDLSLLKLVAAQLANWLSSQSSSSREILEENAAWRKLVQSMGKLNNLAQKELTRNLPQEQRIFAATLEVAGSLIKDGAEATDIRLLDEETGELYFTNTRGPAWLKGTEQDVRARMQRRFQVYSGDARSLGAHVFRTGQLYVMRDAEKDPHFSATFPDTKSMIVAPIRVEDKVFGVLDIRMSEAREFPQHALAIAELLGQQLGLYYHLSQTIHRLQAAEKDLWQFVRAQNLSLEDLQHQLRSPVFQGYARVDALLAGKWTQRDEIESELRAIRGLFGKAKRVTTNTRLLTALARSEPVKPNLTRLREQSLIKLLIEAAMDSSFVAHPDMRIETHVERETFDVLRSAEVWADFDLVEQAVYNILDNAYKYSFRHTIIRVYGGLTSSRRFHITFANYGIPLRHHEVRRCVQRGWRSPEASHVTGEGSGIGLWIVNNIMKLHNGELVITPTAEHLTEIKLVFPAKT